MKSKKGIIFIALLLLILLSFYKINTSYGNTIYARQRILSKRDNHVIILSEIILENNIISEIIDQKSGYGYAQFEANEKGNYLLKTKMMSAQQYEPIVTDRIEINDEFYEIIMCDKSGLEYSEVTYVDNSRGIKDDPVRIEMNNQRVAIFKAPEYSDYKTNVVFYNYKGNKFE